MYLLSVSVSVIDKAQVNSWSRKSYETFVARAVVPFSWEATEPHHAVSLLLVKQADITKSTWRFLLPLAVAAGSATTASRLLLMLIMMTMMLMLVRQVVQRRRTSWCIILPSHINFLLDIDAQVACWESSFTLSTVPRWSACGTRISWRYHRTWAGWCAAVDWRGGAGSQWLVSPSHPRDSRSVGDPADAPARPPARRPAQWRPVDRQASISRSRRRPGLTRSGRPSCTTTWWRRPVTDQGPVTADRIEGDRADRQVLTRERVVTQLIDRPAGILHTATRTRYTHTPSCHWITNINTRQTAWIHSDAFFFGLTHLFSAVMSTFYQFITYIMVFCNSVPIKYVKCSTACWLLELERITWLWLV